MSDCFRSCHFSSQYLSLSTDTKQLVGVMLGSCTAGGAVQWSLLNVCYVMLCLTKHISWSLAPIHHGFFETLSTKVVPGPGTYHKKDTGLSNFYLEATHHQCKAPRMICSSRSCHTVGVLPWQRQSLLFFCCSSVWARYGGLVVLGSRRHNLGPQHHHHDTFCTTESDASGVGWRGIN